MRLMLSILLLVLVGACGRGVPSGADIVVAGDSVLAWNRIEGRSVADQLSARLDQPVGDVSLPLARILDGRGPLNIGNQLSGISDVEWVILNGGANDLSTSCECTDCGDVLDRLISPDGTQGAIPSLVARMRAQGARVLWADYYTSPRYAGTACTRPYTELETRLGRLAARDSGVFLVDMDTVIAPTETRMFDDDRLHPSPEGSARIAALVATALQQADQR